MKKYGIIFVTTFLCLLYFLVNGGGYYWQQISLLSGSLFMTMSFALWLCIFILLVYLANQSVKSGKIIRTTKLIACYICMFTLVLGCISPRWIYASTYLSKIKYRGCYEGTMNTATILFRESGEFEYIHVGFFGATTFEKGTWVKQGDTLEIQYENQIAPFVGDRLFLAKNDFVRIHNDTTNCEDRIIYRGYCRGEY